MSINKRIRKTCLRILAQTCAKREKAPVYVIRLSFNYVSLIFYI